LETTNNALTSEIVERKQAEEQIERLNRDLEWQFEELRTLLDVAPVGIAVARDPGARLINVNPAGAVLLGIRQDQNASKSGPGSRQLPFKVYSGDRELSPDDLPMQRAAASNVRICNQELTLVRDDGQQLTLLEYASPLHDKYGNVRGCLGVFVDITERKRVEETSQRQREMLETVFDHIPVMIAMAGADNRLKLVNRAWEQSLGWTFELDHTTDVVAELCPEPKDRGRVRRFIR
jgi:PAS domain S-box-containing protein